MYYSVRDLQLRLYVFMCRQLMSSTHVIANGLVAMTAILFMILVLKVDDFQPFRLMLAYRSTTSSYRVKCEKCYGIENTREEKQTFSSLLRLHCPGFSRYRLDPLILFK